MKKMEQLKENWKNKDVFKQQLELNIKELESRNSYPNHWIQILNIMTQHTPKRILDFACGCGAFYELCRKEFPNIEYVGVDYAIEAVNIAKEHWKFDEFYVMDYKNLNEEYVSDFDMIIFNGLFDILPNGDEALEHVFSTNPKKVLISRMRFTDNNSFYNTYYAYGIETCAYYHNRNSIKEICENYGYYFPDVSADFYGAILFEKK